MKRLIYLFALYLAAIIYTQATPRITIEDIGVPQLILKATDNSEIDFKSGDRTQAGEQYIIFRCLMNIQ